MYIKICFRYVILNYIQRLTQSLLIFTPRPQNVTRLIFSLKKYHQGYSAIVAMVAGMLTNRISDRQTDRKPVCSLLCNLLIEHP